MCDRFGGLIISGIVCIIVCTTFACMIQFWVIGEKDAWNSPWVKTSMYVSDLHETVTDCCGVTGCECVEAVPYAVSCDQMVWNQTVGVCDGGYHCCREVCPSRSSVANCQCVQRVYHQACQVVCGKCFQYTFKLSYSVAPDMIESITYRKCGRDDMKCVALFSESFPNNTAIDGWYRRNNHRDYLLSEPDNNEWEISAGMVAAISFGCMFVLIACGYFCVTLPQVMEREARRRPLHTEDIRVMHRR